MTDDSFLMSRQKHGKVPLCHLVNSQKEKTYLRYSVTVLQLFLGSSTSKILTYIYIYKYKSNYSAIKSRHPQDVLWNSSIL